MELYVTGITLQVPKGAFKADTMVELSMVEPSIAPALHFDLGETLLGKVIRIGPDIEFNSPGILSMPHSIVDIPECSSICIRHFDECCKQWVQIKNIAGISTHFILQKSFPISVNAVA